MHTRSINSAPFLGQAVLLELHSSPSLVCCSCPPTALENKAALEGVLNAEMATLMRDCLVRDEFKTLVSIQYLRSEIQQSR